MKSIFTLITSFSLCSVFAQNVTLDPNFGNAGITFTPNTSEINDLAIGSDGSIFSSGYSIEAGGSGIYHLTVTKHNSDGSIATNFGTNGIANTIIDYSEFPLDLKIQADGKILVSGSTYLGPTQNGPGDYKSFVVRYSTDGTLDASFGTNGIFQLIHSDSHIASIITLTDGSILLAGNSYGSAAISKLNSNGVLDNQFGTNGTSHLSDMNYSFILWSAILLQDNTILCVGYENSESNNSKLTYCKVDTNGDFIPAFGQNGKVIIDLSNTTPEITELFSMVKESADGKILIGGYASTNILLQIHPNGTPDNSFGTNGILNHPYPFTDFEFQEDGRILIGGNKEMSEYNYGYTVTRLLENGNLDSYFNSVGTFDLDISTGHDYLQSMKVDEDRIIVGGSSKQNSISNFTLASIDISQSLSIQEIAGESFNTYPTPCEDYLFIKTTDLIIQKIELVDAAGKYIDVSTHSLETNTINTTHLSGGVYQLVLTTADGNLFVQKIVKK
ncbi:T9SS type A sorting domain-containing protein [Fluviicola taffensis]|uniref:Delta-60 repeat-containing protein n=1 Tax=Fluviicola taffensis (strain DSM 16823 / NCIMB 13979 / RW262) TaxID=755732 RepID=F2IIJ3_FLUTR|nr:T9SS type A sorting domain-containing protein [Fluviicola taffensis]AEA45955.1 Delta-60 repeat-containing protein [Fluviicola taffensis DSM 16823]